MNIDDDCWRCRKAHHQQKERVKLSCGGYREQISSIVLNTRVKLISQQKILKLNQILFLLSFYQISWFRTF